MSDPNLLPLRPPLMGVDRWISAADSALRTIFATPQASRATPQPESAQAPAATLTEDERRLSGALMRVNHVGEVCAQALYAAQALGARDAQFRNQFDAAAREETDHLAWTQQRLDELGARRSLLNPLWYAGAFAIGTLASRVGGDALSLGFVVETERQVEQHLASHMERLPLHDARSRAIVAQMKADEARHADEALAAGGVTLPAPVRGIMKLAARVMTSTAHHI